MTLKVLSTALAAAAIGFAVAACGGSSASGVVTAPSGGATAATTSKTTATTTATSTSTTAAAVTTPTSGPLSKEPVFSVPSGPAPTKLKVETIIAGSGPAAEDGDKLSVNYVGKLYSNGKTFDASWTDEPGKSFGPFELGAGEVIKGWDEGLKGLRQGGRYELIIPSSLAYGKTGQKPTIPPNAALVFVIDLLKVAPAS